MNITSAISKLNNKHFLSLAGNGSMAVLAMLIVAVLFRNLSLVQMGSWVFFQTIFTLLDGFRSGFLQTALIKFYTGATVEKAKAALGSTWYISLWITIGFLIVNVLAYFLSSLTSNIDLQVAVKWFGITFLFSLPYNITTWILQADQRFDRLLALRVLNQLSLLIMIMVLIFMNNINLNTLLIANLVSFSITSIYTIISGWSYIRFISCKTREMTLEIFHFGKYSVGSMISSYLLRSSDNFIIMFFLGAPAVAMYSIPLRLMEIIEIPLRSFLATAMPQMSNAFNRGKLDELLLILKKYAGVLTIALIPVSIVAVVLANVAIAIIGGDKYIGTDAVLSYKILMLLTIFYPIDRFLGVTLDIINQPKINFYKVMLMLGVNVIFDVLGILYFNSINGVAIASLFTFMAGVWYGYFSLNKYLEFSLSNTLKTGISEITATSKMYFKKKSV